MRDYWSGSRPLAGIYKPAIRDRRFQDGGRAKGVELFHDLDDFCPA